MPDSLLPTTVRLASAAEALAALAAHVQVANGAVAVEPDMRALLAQIATELIGTDAIGPDDRAHESVGMARAILREAAALIDDPQRNGAWANTDAVVLDGYGRVSAAIAGVFALAAARLDGLDDALRAPGARFLDVGTGTAWLAIATARVFPTAYVVGIDIFGPSLALARRNVDTERAGDRVELRELDVTAMTDVDTYDAIWLPLPFLPKDIVPTAIERARAALRPGGWLLPGAFAGPDDRLSRLLTDLRTRRSGGHPWQTGEFLELLRAAGLEDAQELRRDWPAPVQLFAARRAE